METQMLQFLCVLIYMMNYTNLLITHGQSQYL